MSAYSRRALNNDISASPVHVTELHALAKGYSERSRRFLDICVALLGFVLLAPVLAIVALVVAMTFGLPVVSRQERRGENGFRYRLYKFRTTFAAGDNAVRRAAGEAPPLDVGGFLRATGLDELPKLWNILIGDVPLVAGAHNRAAFFSPSRIAMAASLNPRRHPPRPPPHGSGKTVPDASDSNTT